MKLTKADLRYLWRRRRRCIRGHAWEPFTANDYSVLSGRTCRRCGLMLLEGGFETLMEEMRPMTVTRPERFNAETN